MKAKKIITVITSLTALLFLFLGCGAKEKTGTLKINLTDTPGTYEEVFITFSEVSVHKAGDQDNSTDNASNSGWIIIEDKEQGFDLLTLQGGEFTLLAEAELAAGIYTQIRLKISDGADENGVPKNYVKVDGEKYALKIPSGTKSGLKFTHPFRIEADNETVLFVDFDAEKSVKQTGTGNYQLKPTISILSELSPDHGEQGIAGTVEDSSTGKPVEGAVIIPTVEGADTSGLDISAVTNDDGEFSMSLSSGTYTLEVSAEGYETSTTDPIEVGTEFVELEDAIQLTPVAGPVDGGDNETDDGEDGNGGPGEKTGTLKINLTDTPGDYEEVYITFTEVSVHRAGEEQDEEMRILIKKNGKDNETCKGEDNETDDDEDNETDTGEDDVIDVGKDNETGGGWIIISNIEQGFDLLTLQGGNFDLLAEAELAVGKYTQIRLKISDGEDNNSEPKTYVKVDGDKYALKIPSGTKSGLKFTHPFTIKADNETVLYVDFNAEKSVKQTGKGNYQLKPTISILSELSSDQGEQGITGTVQDSADNSTIEGATVSAYLETDNATEPNATATTNEEGYFELSVAEGTYTLTVEAAGYETYTMDSVVVGTGFKELDPIKLDLL